VPWVREERPYIHAINDALTRILEEDPLALVMGEDVLDPYGGAFKATKGLSTRFPDRVITTPLSEAGIVAWGTGAAMRGLHPIVEIMFGDFLALAADQIVNHASKFGWIYGDDVEVPLVIRTPMGGRRGYGPTHSQTLEPLFLGVPGLTIVAPSHLLDPGELLVRSAVEVGSPVLFVENKLLYGRRLVPSDGDRLGQFFVRGASESRFPTLRVSLAPDGPADAAVVAYGGNVPLALEASERLLIEDELVCDVIVPSLVSPPPVDEIAGFAADCGRLVVFEEAPRRGGWGGELVAELAERHPVPGRAYVRVGAPDSPIPSSKALEDAALPGSAALVEAVRGP
jgi:pyruvate/2-oxoglutarate/acetoin dehydrogenase E1 component